MKRFYREVEVAGSAGAWRVELDGRAIRTQRGAEQLLPGRKLAEALAREWREQGEEIDPAAFPLRDMADYALDIVREDRADTIDKLLAFVETDTLCYRADPDEALYRRQIEIWEPLITAFEAREGVTMERVSGIMHRPQSEETLARLRARLEALDDFTLAALQALASLAASLTVGLAALEDDADLDALWDAANLEELWQVELWGRDEQAEARREQRKGEFVSAAQFAQLLAD